MNLNGPAGAKLSLGLTALSMVLVGTAQLVMGLDRHPLRPVLFGICVVVAIAALGLLGWTVARERRSS